jgi:phage virion morphogenesis protein
MVGVTFQLDDRDLIAALGRLDRAAAQPRPAMDAIGAHFVFSTQRNIENETAPSGEKWPKLSPRTAAKRVGKGRRGYDHMLRVTARLYKSIAHDADDQSVEWGTNIVYGRIHQLGGAIDMPARAGTVTLKSIRRKGGGIRSRFGRRNVKGAETRPVSIRAHQVHLPARPYLGISTADRQAVPEIIADYLRHEVEP